MSYEPWSLLACAAAALTLTLSPAASALSCEEQGVRAPAPDATDIPTNTRIWCPTYDDVAMSEVQLVDPLGQQVTGTQTLLSFPGYLMAVFRPDSELAAHTQYQVTCPHFSDWSHSFTTGSGPRQAPPALPSLASATVRASADDGWGASVYALFTGVSPAGTVLVLDLDGRAQLDPSGPSGSLADIELVRDASGWMSVGSGPCLWNWPGATLGASAQIRLGAFDVTGAFSGWSESLTVTLPSAFEEEPAPSNPEPDVPLPVLPPQAPEEVLPSAPVVTPQGELTTPVNDVVRADLASDGGAVPSAQSSGCQLGASSSTWPAAGLLAALACVATRRRRAARAPIPR